MSSQLIVGLALKGLNVAVEACAVTALAWLASRLLRKNAGIRHIVWLCAVAFLAVLLPLNFVSSARRPKPIIPVSISTGPDLAVSQSIVPKPTPPKPTPPKPTAPEPTVAKSIPVTASEPRPPQVALTLKASELPKPQATRQPQKRLTIDWTFAAKCFLLAWTVGCAIAAGWILIAIQGLWTLRRKSDPSPWRHQEIQRLSQKIGLHRRIDLRVSTRNSPASAMTWGVLKPVVLLPQDSDAWSDDLRETVLLHELAHVKRYDSATQLLALFVLALFWWHPCIWIAYSSIRRESEGAADDTVIRSGVRPTDYAAHLLALTARLNPSPKPRLCLGVPMFKPTGIEKRVRAIVDGQRSRGGVTLLQVASVAVGVTVVAFFFANLRPLLAVGPDERSRLFEEAVFVATKRANEAHERRIRRLASHVHRQTVNQNSIPTAQPAKERPQGTLVELHGRPIRTKQKNWKLAPFHPKGPKTRTISAFKLVAVADNRPKPPTVFMPAPNVKAHSPWPRTSISTALVVQAPVADARPDARPIIVGENDLDADDTSTPLLLASATYDQSSTFRLPSFHAIDADSHVKVAVVVGHFSPSIRVLKWNGTRHPIAPVINGVLHLSGDDLVEVEVKTPDLSALNVGGASVVSCVGLRGSSFSL